MTSEIVKQIISMRPVLLGMVAITVLGAIVMGICIRFLRLSGRGTRLSGFFVGLNGRSLWHMTFAWAKFALYASCLLCACPLNLRLDQPYYVLIGGLTVLAFLMRIRPGTFLTEIVGGALLLAGMTACTILLNYINQVRYDTMFVAAYWLLAAFLILCAAALLLREIPLISSERTYFDESGETET